MTVNEAVAAILRHPERFPECILCGGRTERIGVFFPNNPVLYGGRADKQRVIGYGICAACVERPGAQDRVEAILASQIGDASQC